MPDAGYGMRVTGCLFFAWGAQRRTVCRILLASHTPHPASRIPYVPEKRTTYFLTAPKLLRSSNFNRSTRRNQQQNQDTPKTNLRNKRSRILQTINLRVTPYDVRVSRMNQKVLLMYMLFFSLLSTLQSQVRWWLGQSATMPQRAWPVVSLPSAASHYLPDAAQISSYFGAKHHHMRLSPVG